MTRNILTVFIVDLLIVLLEWRNLKKAGKATRWITCIALGLGTVIWVYLSVDRDIFYPSKWLNETFKPFESIR